MSNLWTVLLSQCLLGSSLGLAFISPKASVAEPAKLSLDAVVRAFRAKNGLPSYRAARAELATSRAKAAAGGFQEAPKFSMEVEAAPPGLSTRYSEQSAPPPPGFSGGAKVVISRELILGVDSARNADRFSAEADADVLEKAAELAAEERDLVASYLSLKKEALIFAELARAKPQVEKYVSLARQAARLGTMNGLAATQTEIFSDQILNDIEQSRLSFAAESDRLSTSTGLVFGAIEASKFEDVPMSPSELMGQGTSPQLAAIERRQAALDLERQDLLSRRVLELGFGVSKAWGEKTDTSLIAEITLPLGIGETRRSEAQTLTAARAAAGAEAELVKTKAARELARIDSEIKRLAGQAGRLKGRVERLSSLLDKTDGAFRRGQGEVSEVIATLRALLDVRLEEIKTRVELETAQISRHYLLHPVAT